MRSKSKYYIFVSWGEKKVETCFVKKSLNITRDINTFNTSDGISNIKSNVNKTPTASRPGAAAPEVLP